MDYLVLQNIPYLGLEGGKAILEKGLNDEPLEKKFYFQVYYFKNT